jgi:hypothetical protein
MTEFLDLLSQASTVHATVRAECLSNREGVSGRDLTHGVHIPEGTRPELFESGAV